MTDYQVSRLGAEHAQAIVDCFDRVYGGSYANELFHDAGALAEALASGRLGSVGAIGRDGRVFGHMAMTVHPEAVHVELGNTAVDPAARGGGLAWQIGAALSVWCRELGYRGFLHYPTTDHHIMQRRSVERGFETGLMLGYIPAETDGRVRPRSTTLRQAATIVYEGYEPGAAAEGFVPERYAGLIEALAAPTGLSRTWRSPAARGGDVSRVDSLLFARRGLARLDVVRCGLDLEAALGVLADNPLPCRQVDFRMDDPAIGAGVETAVALGFRFCGWLPGYRQSDVLRLQRLDDAVTDLAPPLENPVARTLLNRYLTEAR
jgi:GNAT superfamily N-acetyltransferase